MEGKRQTDIEWVTRRLGIAESYMKINVKEVSLQRKTRNAYLSSRNRACSTPPHEI